MAVSWTPTNPFYHELILRYVQSGTATWEPEAPSNTCRNGCGRFLRHSHEFYSFLGADPQGLKASKLTTDRCTYEIVYYILCPVEKKRKLENFVKPSLTHPDSFGMLKRWSLLFGIVKSLCLKYWYHNSSQKYSKWTSDELRVHMAGSSQEIIPTFRFHEVPFRVMKLRLDSMKL